MAWVKMDDQRALNPKLRAAGFAARGLDECAIEWCSQYGTDGWLSDGDLALLGRAHDCDRVEELAAKLVAVERWDRDDKRGGYLIRDYLEFNPTSAEVRERRQERSASGRRGGLLSGKNRRRDQGNEAKPKQQLEAKPKQQLEGELHAGDEARGLNPVPSRPVPITTGAPIGEPEPPVVDNASPPATPDGREERRAIRKPDELWDAMTTACAIDTNAITQSARGGINRAVKDIREVGGTPEEIRARAARHKRKWPNATLTPLSLARHWAELVPPSMPRPPAPPSVPQEPPNDAPVAPMPESVREGITALSRRVRLDG